jgi:nicotinate-nucleotide pyrophosphorylase (carboxylating)
MGNSILREFILRSLEEDIGDGDHSSLACIPPEAEGKAKLLIKGKGILAGCRVAMEVFNIVDNSLIAEVIIDDGSPIAPGDIAFYVEGKKQSVLKSERLVLNIMQRMSGIATSTRDMLTDLQD